MGVCAVVAADDPRLPAWLAFHRLVGVERFFLYLPGPPDAAATVAAGDVVARPWPFTRPHRPAYDHCLFHHGAGVEWLGFLAVDEFLFATDGEDLRTALATFRRWPGIGVHRLVYGPAAETDGPLLRRCIRRASVDLAMGLPAMLRAPDLDPTLPDSYRALATRVAFIVQPARTHACLGRHDFAFRDDAAAATEEGRPVAGGWSERVSVERLRVNQYWDPARDPAADRFGDGGGGPAAPADLARLAPLRTEIDTAIWPIAARLPGWRR